MEELHLQWIMKNLYKLNDILLFFCTFASDLLSQLYFYGSNVIERDEENNI